MQKKLFVLIGFVLGVTACHNQNHQSANKNDESALLEQKIIKNAEEAHDLKALATQLYKNRLVISGYQTTHFRHQNL